MIKGECIQGTERGVAVALLVSSAHSDASASVLRLEHGLGRC